MRTVKTTIVVACALAGALALAGCAQAPATPAKDQAGTQNREAMFQVSLLQSLTEGDFEGSVAVGELKKHGDTGIGTFDGLDGELVMVDGEVWQATGDGKVNNMADDKTIPFGRVAALSHWAPALLPDGVDQTIRETAFWTPPQLTAPSEGDEINSSLCHGFIFDMAGVEVDPANGKARIDRYVTMHDCGRVLHPGMVEGQIRGGFAQAVGATFFEELAYAEDAPS